MSKVTSLIEAMEHVSKLRSRRAVLQTCVDHIRSLYRSSDAGEPEMKITRDDHALVSATHIEETLSYLDSVIETIDVDLEELTTQRVMPRDPEPEEVPENLNDVIRIVAKKEGKKNVRRKA